MNRKQFLKTSLGFGAAGLIPGILTAQNKTTAVPTYDIWELVGKSKPALHGDDFRLRKLAAEAFTDMRSDAMKVGINIYSQSSYRGFQHQLRIWNGKFKSHLEKGATPEQALERTLKDSAIPGTSRHHWGTDLDMIDAAVMPQPLERLETANFKMGGAYEHLNYWLKENAQKYKFYMTYPDDRTRTGFKHEPWQYSFSDLSIQIIREFKRSNWKPILKDNSILGYQLFTTEYLTSYELKYLLGINPKLK